MTADKTYKLINGNNIDVLKTFPNNSIDSIVTDPPYELGFMGKKWDSSGIAYSVALWSECLRVLKPGGHLLAFGGTRTHHRMTCAIEDAGFDIRDELDWVYGSGFPKSLDVSKAIDKAAGAEREVIGVDPIRAGRLVNQQNIYTTDAGWSAGNRDVNITVPATNGAKQWEGWGTALKPAREPIVMARKPFETTIAANVLEHSTGALNIDGCRIGSGNVKQATAGQRTVKWGVSEGGCSYEKGTGAQYSTEGRWPANLILSHSDDCVLVGEKRVKTGTAYEPVAKPMERTIYGVTNTLGRECGFGDVDGMETVEQWDCVDDCPVRMLDEQSGISTSSGGRIGKKSVSGVNIVPAGKYCAGNPGLGDTGGASRFFYVAKTSRSEREAGCEHLPIRSARETVEREEGAPGTQSPSAGAGRTIGNGTVVRNNHPTVKPIALMRYLIRLITPPGGVVLDCFAGSGSTGCAAMLEGCRFIGIDLSADYLVIAKARIEHWKNAPTKKPKVVERTPRVAPTEASLPL